MLGLDLRRRLPLASYLSAVEDAPVVERRNLRRALLERMAVMASKGLVREMLVDLHSAASLDPAQHPGALDRGEAGACREVGNFPFFQMRLFDAPEPIMTRLSNAAQGQAGKAIVAAIARGIFHAARHPRRPLPERKALARCALRLFSACGPARTVGAYLPARSQR